MTLDEMQGVWVANFANWNSEWSLNGSDYRKYRMFVDVLRNEKPVSAEWLGSEDWRMKHLATEENPYGQRLPDMTGDTGVTYEGCVDWKFDVVKRHLTVIVWQGEMLNGDRRNKRARWVYEIRDEHTRIIEVIERVLFTAVWERAERDQAEWEEEQRRIAIQARVDKMIEIGKKVAA